MQVISSFSGCIIRRLLWPSLWQRSSLYESESQQPLSWSGRTSSTKNGFPEQRPGVKLLFCPNSRRRFFVVRRWLQIFIPLGLPSLLSSESLPSESDRLPCFLRLNFPLQNFLSPFLVWECEFSRRSLSVSDFLSTVYLKSVLLPGLASRSTVLTFATLLFLIRVFFLVPVG